jgi:formylglycine-generating enzyme
MQTRYTKPIEIILTLALSLFLNRSFAQKDKDFLSKKVWAELYAKRGNYTQAIQSYAIAISIDPSCHECQLAIKGLKTKLKEKRLSSIQNNNKSKPISTFPKSKNTTNNNSGIKQTNLILPEMVSLNYPFSNQDSTINKFSISNAEVSQKEWKIYTEAKGLEFPKIPESMRNDNFPVVNISWQEAKDYCQWLFEQTEESFDLPTKEEWLIARSTIENLKNESWIYENSNRNLHEIKKKNKNKNGLYDIEGNVSEWVDDWSEKDFVENIDLKKFFEENETSKNRAVCGCSFKDESYFCKKTYIQSLDGMVSKDNIGFRVVKRNY